MEHQPPDEGAHPVHVFPPSIYPFLVCMGLTGAMFGLVFHATLPGVLAATIGILLLLGGVIGWMLEDTDLYEATTRGHG